MSSPEDRREAACGYMAAIYDQWGRVHIHEYAEQDGRWYLDVTIPEPQGIRLPFSFIRKEFGGRIVYLTNRDGQSYTAWRAVGPRAYDVLYSIRPYVLGPLSAIDFALDTFHEVNEDDYDDSGI